MKVLYTFYHGAAFAWSLIHKLSQHPDDEAYFLLAEGWDWCAGRQRFLLLLRFIDIGVFKGVYTYDNCLGKDGKVFDTLEKTEDNILKEMDKRLKNKDVILQNLIESILIRMEKIQWEFIYH